MDRLTELLYLAINSPLGIVVACQDAGQTQNRLYAARNRARDTSLARLQVRRSPSNPEGEIWIVKGEEK